MTPPSVNLARTMLRDAAIRAPTRRCGVEISTVASAALFCRATVGDGDGDGGVVVVVGGGKSSHNIFVQRGDIVHNRGVVNFSTASTSSSSSSSSSSSWSSSSAQQVEDSSSDNPSSHPPLSPPPAADGSDDDVDALPRQKLSSVKISEVLKRKHTLRWVEPVINMDATVRDAITVCIDRKLNGMMVVDKSDTAHRLVANSTSLELKQKCVGLVTSRDILRMMAASIKSGKSSDEILDERISDIMKPIDRVIYGRPDETIATCRAIMAKNGIQCLPILAEGRVEGILTARDMQDVYFDAKDRGGKKNYLRDISDRVGLSSDLTSMVSVNTRGGGGSGRPNLAM
jgi:CBS domain-containing protein